MINIEINPLLCKACGLCINVCRNHVLARGEAVTEKGFCPTIAVRTESCVGCADCAVMCPEAAIVLYR